MTSVKNRKKNRQKPKFFTLLLLSERGDSKFFNTNNFTALIQLLKKIGNRAFYGMVRDINLLLIIPPFSPPIHHGFAEGTSESYFQYHNTTHPKSAHDRSTPHPRKVCA